MMQPRPERSLFARIVSGFVMTVCILVSLGFIISAYSGHVSPLEWRYAPAAVMTFPMWLLAMLVLLLLTLIWWRRAAVVVIIAMALCMPQIWDFTPLNLPRGKMNEEERARSFSLMTYNVMKFNDQDQYVTHYSNPQIDYILSEKPDVVCIQEALCMIPDDYNHITQEQLSDLNSVYPYIYVVGESFAMMSKFKAEPIPIDFPAQDFQSGNIAAWRLYIHDEVVNLFVVHLRSFGLDTEDRSLFREMTTIEDVNRRYINEARADLLPKIVSASKERAAQVELLIGYLKKYGGETAIICGDFNDPVGCWPLYELQQQSSMKQVYPEVAFGPTITYNANHFYFRIDHILYRGHLEPYSLHRGDLKASDHYPLTAEFLITKGD